MQNEEKKVNFREFILGGQDGLVNILGLVLGIASATFNSNIIIISGLVATVAESVSMTAVAYTSSKAAEEYYEGMIEDDKKHVKNLLLKKHKILLHEFSNPLRSAWMVGLATIIGSLIPLVPFFFFSVKYGIISSLILSAFVLFIVGAFKAKMSIGNWRKSGLQLMFIGLIAALIGYGFGLLLNNYVIV